MSDDSLVRRLEASLTELGKKVSTLGTQLDKLDRVSKRLVQADQRLDALDRQVTAFIDEDRAARSRQFAQTALVDARAEHDRQFGHRRKVRRGVAGALQAMTTGTVRQPFLPAAERLVVDASDYWLSSAYVALAAWADGSQESAEAGALEAVRCDPGRSALFFALVLARFGRHDAAAEWIAEYARTQDRHALTGEFTTILDVVARGALGSRARQLLLGICQGWRDQIGQSTDWEAQQVPVWREFIRRQRRPLPDTFHPLGTVGRDWAGHLGKLEAVTAFGRAERWLRNRLGGAAENDEVLRAAVDDLLRDLIAAPDQAEEALLGTVQQWQAIADPGSHPPSADHDQPGEPARLDFLTLCTAIATGTYQGALAPQTTRFCLVFSREAAVRAVTDLSEQMQGSRPKSIEVDVSGWRQAIEPSDDPEALVRKFSGWADQAMLTEQAQAANRRLLIGRSSAKIESAWETRKHDGQETVYEATRQAIIFFQRWQLGIRAAGECARLLQAQATGAWGDEQDSHPVSGPAAGPARDLPDWDLRLPDRP